MKGSISEFELGVIRARMLDAARAKGVRRFVQVSTDEVMKALQEQSVIGRPGRTGGASGKAGAGEKKRK